MEYRLLTELLFVMVVLPEAPSLLIFYFLFVFRVFIFVVFFVFFEVLVLTISLSFGNLASWSCSTYLDKETTFLLLKMSFSSSVSQETMADTAHHILVKGRVARKCWSFSIIGSKNGRCGSVSALSLCCLMCGKCVTNLVNSAAWVRRIFAKCAAIFYFN